MYCSSSVKNINSSFTRFLTYGCQGVWFSFSFLLFPPLKSDFLARKEKCNKKVFAWLWAAQCTASEVSETCHSASSSMFLHCLYFCSLEQVGFLDREAEREAAIRSHWDKVLQRRHVYRIISFLKMPLPKKIKPTELKGNRHSWGLARLYNSSVIYGLL